MVPALLFNSESWIGITEAQINELQGFQDKFLRKLLHLPNSTPKAILHWDGEMELIKCRITRQKLFFLTKLMLKHESNICKRAVMNESLLGVEGLGHECKVLTDKLGLPDVMQTPVSKSDITDAILKLSCEETKEEVEASRKVGDRATADPEDRKYLTYMTLSNSRMWMRVRARSTKGVKVNNKRSFTNLLCRFCDNGAEETQEHLEVCTGCEYERRGKKMSKWTGKVIFWRRVTAKIVAWGKGDSDELLLPGGGTLT